MGNRAVITIKEKNRSKEDWQSLYLHWNGGRDSVEPLLHVAKLYGVRCQSDPSYAIARLSQITGNTLGGTLSLGVGTYSQLDTDNFDNGVYVVGLISFAIFILPIVSPHYLCAPFRLQHFKLLLLSANGSVRCTSSGV